MRDRPRVVIVGGGFGGLYATKMLSGAPAQVTLFDRRNFHLFQPLLYQVAMGALSPGDIASPLRAIFRRQANAEVLLGEVTDIDPAARTVILTDGEIAYDMLIIATGSTHSYFGHLDWADRAPGLKTIEDATEIRRRVLLAYEAAEREADPERRRLFQTFVIAGGGPTGVELAGALGELAFYTMRQDFRHLNPLETRIILIDGGERILATYPPELSESARRELSRLGVIVRTSTLVTGLEPEAVLVKSGDKTERIPAGTVLWAAGVQASPLGRLLAQKTGAPIDRVGRIVVAPDLSVPGHPDIFVIGDLAHYAHTPDAKPLPGVAPVAMQEGAYVARLIRARVERRPAPPSFRYRGHGNLAVIGRNAAVADLGRICLTGFPAWLVWALVHIRNLVEFENRLLVFIKWVWEYFTHRRDARLITGEAPWPLVASNPPAVRDDAVPGRV